MKNIILLFLFLLQFGFSQIENNRIQSIKNNLTSLSVDNTGLTENMKTEINVSNITLSNFLLAIADVHKININVSPELNNVSLVNSFSNVTVKDLLVFLCKEYDLTIDFTGNILSVKKYIKPIEEPKERVLPVSYESNNNTLSLDVKNDKLYDVFKRIMDVSGKNLVFSPGLETKTITTYFRHIPFDIAMDKLAFSNNLYVEKTKDGFYLFEDNARSIQESTKNNGKAQVLRQKRRRKSNFDFKVIDYDNKLLDVDFSNIPIVDVIHDIGNELNIDVFTATPLDNAGVASLKAKSINFDYLLHKLFEPQSNVNPNNKLSRSGGDSGNDLKNIFTFKKENNIYFFGTSDQLSVRQVEVIHLMHRSVSIIGDNPFTNTSINNSGFNQGSQGIINPSYNNQFDNINRNPSSGFNQGITSQRSGKITKSDTSNNNIVDIIPEEIKNSVKFEIDTELNSIYVSGTQENIERFKKFIQKIDKPIPLVLIEVMIIELNKSANTETGITWGIGENPSTTQGGIYPQTDLTLGAQTINKIINGFSGFGSLNIGQVVPNFFSTIKLMEQNGNLRVKSTPRLSTLNGHIATFSSGEMSYYTVTQRNIYGTDNPQTSEITNFQPISAELGLAIKPYVSGNKDVTLSIDVIQSSFGARISENAPPDITSRTFNSSVRAKDQDIIVLGGIEVDKKFNSGTGVPLLSRIPILKWLFSSRKSEATKSKLAVLIKPTVID